MSWASSSPALAAAVSEAGGLGTVAAGPMRLDDLRATVRAVKARTSKPFALNVPSIARAAPNASISPSMSRCRS